jgi:hypothetical protein
MLMTHWTERQYDEEVSPAMIERMMFLQEVQNDVEKKQQAAQQAASRMRSR